MVLAVLFFDRLKLDDPVGALSVHLCGGIWGTLAVGIFSTNPAYTFLTQFTGVACAAVSFPCALAIFYVLKKTIGIRVSEDEELRLGLTSESTAWRLTPGSRFSATNKIIEAKNLTPLSRRFAWCGPAGEPFKKLSLSRSSGFLSLRPGGALSSKNDRSISRIQFRQRARARGQRRVSGSPPERYCARS